MELNTITSDADVVDEDSFQTLYNDHHKELRSYAMRYVRSVQSAEDVVQDVFVRLWERWKKRAPREAVPYLYRAVRYRAIDILRHQRIVEKWHERWAADTAYVYSDDGVDAVEDLHLQELEDAIDEALDRLPARRRQIFNLSRSEGLSYAEIAEAMNVPIKRVERQISRSLKSLRSDLDDYLN